MWSWTLKYIKRYGFKNLHLNKIVKRDKKAYNSWKIANVNQYWNNCIYLKKIFSPVFRIQLWSYVLQCLCAQNCWAAFTKSLDAPKDQQVLFRGILLSILVSLFLCFYGFYPFTFPSTLFFNYHYDDYYHLLPLMIILVSSSFLLL